jgi:hypothetical protein
MATYIELSGESTHRLDDSATVASMAEEIRTSLNHSTAVSIKLHDGSTLVVPPSGVFVRLFDQ